MAHARRAAELDRLQDEARRSDARAAARAMVAASERRARIEAEAARLGPSREERNAARREAIRHMEIVEYARAAGHPVPAALLATIRRNIAIAEGGRVVSTYQRADRFPGRVAVVLR
jgi:hypothetical protein